MGCPLASVYKGGRGGGAADPMGAPGGVLLQPGVGLPPLALLEKERRKEGERRKEKGAAPLVQFGPEEGCAPPSYRPLSSIPVWPNKAHILPGEFP